jgi:uncharacterized membrane protein HdeD (DUF308 family)
MANKKLIKVGYWIGIPIVLLVIIFGILLVTKVITFDITQIFFGWFLIIVGAGSLIEPFIVKALGIC